MIKSRMQLNALIRNKAAGDGDKAQILLRIYMMERLLERISVSRYRDNFILKGGMLVSSLVGVDMRTTMDIDTTVRALPLTQEKAREFLEEIMAIDLEDNVSFRITKVEDIMEGHESYDIVMMAKVKMKQSPEGRILRGFCYGDDVYANETEKAVLNSY